MDIKQIRYFLTLADSLNFTEASKHHSVSQPALSMAIQRLEEDVGAPLFHRDGKHTRLTALGIKLKSQFALISAAEDRAREIADSHLDQGHTKIAIGISNSLGPRPFVRFLGKFCAQNPAVRITLHQVEPETTHEQLLSGILDACFCALPGDPNHKLKFSPLFTERLMIAMSPTHPLASRSVVTFRDLGEHMYLDRLNCEFRPTFIEAADTMGLTLYCPVQSDREDWIQQMVAQGIGVTALAEHSRVVEGITFRPLENTDLSRDVSLVSILGSTCNSVVQKLDAMARRHDWDDLHDCDGETFARIPT